MHEKWDPRMVALQEVQARGLKFGLSDSELPFSTN